MSNSVQNAQAGLRARYKSEPALATVTCQATTGGNDPADPFHLKLQTGPRGDTEVPTGVHASVGGPYDGPCPGDLLCAALAACQDSSIRMVANHMGIELVELRVQVRGTLDVRGAMGIERSVPVGFQSMTTEVHLKAKEGTPPEHIAQLRAAAEHCCVVRQTLQSPPTQKTTFHT